MPDIQSTRTRSRLGALLLALSLAAAIPIAAQTDPQSQPSPQSQPGESLIERAREAAFEFSEKLPNFTCEEFMARYAQRGSQKQSQDVVSAEIIYDNQQESYRDVKINGAPTNTTLEEIGGAWSTGEFASTLLSLFSPSTDAQFHAAGTDTISGVRAQVYDFQVQSQNSHWRITVESHTLDPAYSGSVWIDPTTARVLRIEMQARNIPSDFPEDQVESAVDYSTVNIAGSSYLLPVHAENLGCQRGTSDCGHNIIDFRNYQEFKVDIKIGN